MPDITQCVARCLAGTGSTIPPRPPSASILGEMLGSVRHVINQSPDLQRWMQEVGLDPSDVQDGLLAIGLAITSARPLPVRAGDPA